MAAEQVAQVLMAMDDPAVASEVEAGHFEALDARGLTAYERFLLREAAHRGEVSPALRYARFHLEDRGTYIDLVGWAERSISIPEPRQPDA
jgi:hypothetical protein